MKVSLWANIRRLPEVERLSRRQIMDRLRCCGKTVQKTFGMERLQAFRNAAQQGTVVTRMGRTAKVAASDIESLFAEVLFSKEKKVANE